MSTVSERGTNSCLVVGNLFQELQAGEPFTKSSCLFVCGVLQKAWPDHLQAIFNSWGKSCYEILRWSVSLFSVKFILSDKRFCILPFARGDVNQGRVSTPSHFMFYFRLVEIGLLGLRPSCWQTKPDDKEGLFGYKFCSLDRSSDVLHLGRRVLGTECMLEGGKFCAVGVWFTSISKTTSCLWSTLTEVPQEPDLRLTKCHCHSIAAHFVAFDLEELKVQWDSLRPWRFCERSFEASSVGDRYRVEWRAANGLECSPAKWPALSDLSHRLVMRFLEASKHVSCLDRSRDWVTKVIFFQALNWDPWSDFEVAWSGSEGLLMGQVLSIKVSIVWPTVFRLISCSWLQFLLSVLKLFQKNSKQTAEAEPAELASFRIERWDQVNRPTPGSHVSKPTRNFWSSGRAVKISNWTVKRRRWAFSGCKTSLLHEMKANGFCHPLTVQQS